MKNEYKLRLVLILTSVVLVLTFGCTTVEYGDPTDSKAVSTNFGSSDLQQTASKMVDSMLSDPAVVKIVASRKPVLIVDKIKNKTQQHVDTESITDSIRTKLIRAGKFRFLDRSTDNATIEEINRQQNQGLTDPKTARKFRTQIGAEYMLTANLTQITEKSGRTKDVYYKLTMNMKNLKTGILDWADEIEIRKVRKKSILGL